MCVMVVSAATLEAELLSMGGSTIATEQSPPLDWELYPYNVWEGSQHSCSQSRACGSRCQQNCH